MSRSNATDRAQQIQSFTELVEITKGDVARLVNYLLGPSPRIDDVVSEVYVTVWKKWDQRPGNERDLSWVLTIASNHARNQRRTEEARRRYELSVADLDLLEPPSRYESSRIELIRECLRALDADELALVVMIYWESRPQTEVARLLGISEAAVNMKISRARQRMKAKIVEIETIEGSTHD